MKAVYNNKLYFIEEALGDGVKLEDGPYVSFGDPGLIVDPTDDEVDLTEAVHDHPEARFDPARCEACAGELRASRKRAHEALRTGLNLIIGEDE